MNAASKIGYSLKCARLARQLSTALNNRLNYYELLGVSPTATAAEIKSAYFERTKLYHPDVATPTDESLTLFRRISEAYEVLGSPILRRDYDENVLGLFREGLKDLEDDPMSLHKKVVSNGKLYSWTKDHQSMLRKQQYVYNSTSYNEPKKKTIPEGSTNLTLTLILIIAITGFFFLNLLNMDKKKEIKIL